MTQQRSAAELWAEADRLQKVADKRFEDLARYWRFYRIAAPILVALIIASIIYRAMVGE